LIIKHLRPCPSVVNYFAIRGPRVGDRCVLLLSPSDRESYCDGLGINFHWSFIAVRESKGFSSGDIEGKLSFPDGWFMFVLSHLAKELSKDYLLRQR
jgi:hypothetical protein